MPLLWLRSVPDQIPSHKEDDGMQDHRRDGCQHGCDGEKGDDRFLPQSFAVQRSFLLLRLGCSRLAGRRKKANDLQIERFLNPKEPRRLWRLNCGLDFVGGDILD